jgi:diphthamide synthase (EF-2-diphthine--ammonia ligase)
MQAEAAGLPLWVVPLPWPCTNNDYEKCMAQIFSRAIAEKVSLVAFGDLFLQDIRAYREKQLAGIALTPIFPLWQMPTAALAKEMIAAGLRAKLVCIDPKVLASSFAGREFDTSLLADLPPSADPCGENGEFHTFVYSGPMLRSAIDAKLGETIERDSFLYCDLLATQALSLGND